MNIPVTTIDAAKLLPGALTRIDAQDPGPGAGTGGGGGRGPGMGGSDGAGLGGGRFGSFGDGVYNGAGGVVSPVLLREVKPAYTVDAMRAKIQGVVEMEVIVLPDGSVDPARIRITRSLDPTFGLDRQAVAAVKEWRFKAGTYKNQPVAVRVNVELTFTLR
jgi:TonB family protein